jgi:DNA mismatch repair protein MutL
MPESQTGLFENQDQQPTVFQLQNKFIIKPLVSGLLIVHQRNAHVRVLYEQLLKKLEGQNGVSQQLLFPIFFEMNQQEIQVLQNCKSELELAGFQFKSLEADQVQLEGIPLELKESEVSRVLESVVMQEELELPNAQHHPQSTLALKLAKGMAVRSGDAMEPAGMNHLLDQLFGCAEPTITPQGKRTFDKLTGDQLASKFN